MAQPTVVISPELEFTRSLPVLTSAKHPVPYVFFADPGSKQHWPNSDACWSPATPAIGTACPADRSPATWPKTSLEDLTSGRIALGTSSMARSSSSQSRESMLNSIVRLAFVTSVAWTSLFVKFHISQESTVPQASSPRSARR